MITISKGTSAQEHQAAIDRRVFLGRDLLSPSTETHRALILPHRLIFGASLRRMYNLRDTRRSPSTQHVYGSHKTTSIRDVSTSTKGPFRWKEARTTGPRRGFHPSCKVGGEYSFHYCESLPRRPTLAPPSVSGACCSPTCHTRKHTSIHNTHMVDTRPAFSTIRSLERDLSPADRALTYPFILYILVTSL